MEQRITDTHIHIVPNVDDGAVDLTMALEMIKMAYEQGARNIFCTSHNVYDKEELTRSSIHVVQKMLLFLEQKQYISSTTYVIVEITQDQYYMDTTSFISIRFGLKAKYMGDIHFV